MKRPWVLVALLVCGVGCGDEKRPTFAGPSIDVLFDERHGLEGGELVRFHDFEIGEVESVDIARSRVRARLRLDEGILEELTEEITFSVETEDGERYLEAHVLDPNARPLEGGATLEGVDSGFELTYRRASSRASELIDGISSSEWFREAEDLAEDLRRDLEEIDWSREEREVREAWEETVRELEEIARATNEEAREGYEVVREKVEDLADELEESGRSEEAKKLRERLKTLWEDIARD